MAYEVLRNWILNHDGYYLLLYLITIVGFRSSAPTLIATP